MNDIAPRWLTAQEVCAYIHCSRTQLDRMVATGAFPPPTRALGARMIRWDRLAIDAAMSDDGQSAGNTMDAAIERMRDDIAQRRPRRSQTAA